MLGQTSTNKEFKKPINILEKEEDTKLTWRKKVNNELKTNYKKIYNLIDKSIYLKVPNFKYVLKNGDCFKKKT